MLLLIHKYHSIILAVAMLAAGVMYKYKQYEARFMKSSETPESAAHFSEKQLAKYNGIDNDKLYLAIMGFVFDVTEGRKNYEKGAPYHYFVGKDGSRALVTGNFNDETEAKDHILDLACNELDMLVGWNKTFTNKYTSVGILIGRYYDQDGRKTKYFEEFDIKMEECRIMKQQAEERDIHPPCNVAWNVEENVKVWCTKASGGVTRDWVGVPRQLFTPGDDKPRCVCINPDHDNSGALLKEYNDCEPTSTICWIN